ASCSSSTNTARRSILRCDALGHRQLGDFQADPCTLSRNALQSQLTACAVNGAQPLVHVAQPDPVAERLLEPLFGHSETVIMNFDDRLAVAQRRGDGDA